MKLKARLCTDDCEGVPEAYTFGGFKKKLDKHWHVRCWMCGAWLVSIYPRSYTCQTCEYSECPALSSAAWSGMFPWGEVPGEYDPEFARTHPSPALHV